MPLVQRLLETALYCDDLPRALGFYREHRGEAAGLAALEARLAARGVAIESRIRWSAGGESLYCRDPDGHSVEFATPGLWPSY